MTFQHMIEWKAMGCKCKVVLETENKSTTILNSVPMWIEEWEQTLSRFRSDSELTILNSNSGLMTSVSETMWNVLMHSIEAEEISNGLVQATVLDAVVNSGYDKSFELINHNSNKNNKKGVISVNSMKDIELNYISHSVCLPKGMHLDFGGIAKGWASNEVMEKLQLYGDVIVCLGGDISASKKNNKWSIGIDNPFVKDTIVDVVLVDNAGIATSGTDYRRWKDGERWKHHIIDPRTGNPCETDILTSTVIAPNSFLAEVASKVTLIKGSKDGLEWIENNDMFASLFVLNNGDIIKSSSLSKMTGMRI